VGKQGKRIYQQTNTSTTAGIAWLHRHADLEIPRINASAGE
jgi:hypothetical protein